MRPTEATEYAGACGYGRFTRSHRSASSGLDRSPVFATLAEALAWDGAKRDPTAPYLLVAIMPDAGRSEMVWDIYRGHWVPNRWPAFPGPMPAIGRTNEVDPVTFHCLRSSEEPT